MFTVSRFEADDAREMCQFLNFMRTEHWSLTSLAFLPRPDRVPLVRPGELVEMHRGADAITTYLLRHEGKIISLLQVGDKHGDGRIAVFSGVETHPDHQRRGTCWRFLGRRALHDACAAGVQCIEAQTWPFNRKGIPLYKRIGFRAVPGTSLVMENYLPMMLRHPLARLFFAEHDALRTLQCRRSYGYDGSLVCGIELFSYLWRHRERELRIQVDRERKQIVAVGTEAWGLRCFTRPDLPRIVFYQVHNRSARELVYVAQLTADFRQRPLRRRLAGGQSVAGHVRVTDPGGRPLARVEMTCEVEGVEIPFVLGSRRDAAAAAIPALQRCAG